MCVAVGKYVHVCMRTCTHTHRHLPVRVYAREHVCVYTHRYNIHHTVYSSGMIGYVYCAHTYVVL
jgi:hypothetical protein